GASPSPRYPGDAMIAGLTVGRGSDPTSYRRSPAIVNWMFWISSSSVPSPSTSGAANAEHHGSHSSGPTEVSATLSPDTSTATTCMPSPSEGHPRSPVFVATQAVPSTPGANMPATLVTLQTGNPSPMSSSTPTEGLGVGSVCCGKLLVGSGSGCHENPSTSPSTRSSGSDPSVGMAMIDSPSTPFSADP